MSIVKFLLKASERDFLPVDLVEHVIPDIVALDVKDEIYPFWDEKLDLKTMIGHIVVEDIDFNGETRRIATITYGVGPPEVQRVVCCKELIHLLDPDHCKAVSDEEIEHLISHIVLSPVLSEPLADGYHVYTDRMAVLAAVTVLFPLGAREILLPAFKAGKITRKQIAEMAELPEGFVAAVMHDGWPDIHASVLKILSSIEIDEKIQEIKK